MERCDSGENRANKKWRRWGIAGDIRRDTSYYARFFFRMVPFFFTVEQLRRGL